MTTTEYDIMDQLYFVTSYDDIKELSGVEESTITTALWKFIDRRWVKCFDGPENEIEVEEGDFRANFAKYHYLASKEGLMAHNMR
jgi:hypothetical protein